MSPTFRPLTRTVLRTPFLQTIRPNRATAAFSTSIPRLATQDYGSGDGNPAGENPQAQGKNPSEHLEHPGPPPPDVGKGSGGSSGGKGEGDVGTHNAGGPNKSGAKGEGESGRDRPDGASASGASTAEKGGE